MSVWPNAPGMDTPLASPEGALVSVSIHVDPRHLELLLEALAQVSFPINPQIYHDAALVYVYADGHEETEITTLVEFPAYERRIAEVKRTLEPYGFSADVVHVINMLDEIHSSGAHETAPAGAAYRTRYRVKHRTCAAIAG